MKGKDVPERFSGKKEKKRFLRRVFPERRERKDFSEEKEKKRLLRRVGKRNRFPERRVAA